MSTQTGKRPNAPLAATLERFFEIKTSCDVDGTMSYFAPDLATYTDATLGWNLDSFQALRDVFTQYMPGWGPPARSYATRILSNEVSALVHMVDSPELFGGELRILAAVDWRDGKIIRWVDYWDAAAFPDELYSQFRTPDAEFPRDLKDAEIPTQAAPEIVAAATAIQKHLPPATRRQWPTCCTPTSSSLICPCEHSSSAGSRPSATSIVSWPTSPTAAQAPRATSSEAPLEAGSSGPPDRNTEILWA